MGIRSRTMITIAGTAAYLVSMASPALGMDYRSFAGALSNSFYGNSTVELAASAVLAAIVMTALIWAGRVSARQRQAEIDAAYERSVQRKAQNQALLKARRDLALRNQEAARNARASRYQSDNSNKASAGRV